MTAVILVMLAWACGAGPFKAGLDGTTLDVSDSSGRETDVWEQHLWKLRGAALQEGSQEKVLSDWKNWQLLLFSAYKDTDVFKESGDAEYTEIPGLCIAYDSRLDDSEQSETQNHRSWIRRETPNISLEQLSPVIMDTPAPPQQIAVRPRVKQRDPASHGRASRCDFDDLPSTLYVACLRWEDGSHESLVVASQSCRSCTAFVDLIREYVND